MIYTIDFAETADGTIFRALAWLACGKREWLVVQLGYFISLQIVKPSTRILSDRCDLFGLPFTITTRLKEPINILLAISFIIIAESFNSWVIDAPVN